jgi:hypothetical protein
MANVIRTTGDYKIKTVEGDITLDTLYDDGGTDSYKAVRIIGDLVVTGSTTSTTTISSTNLEIEDNLIILNKGETGNGITLYQSGISIDRGVNSDPPSNDWRSTAVIAFDERLNYSDPVTATSYDGSFIFKIETPGATGPAGPRLTGIHTNSIDTRVTDSGTRSKLFLNANGISVQNVANYEDLIGDDDDIPNVAWIRNNFVLQSGTSAPTSSKGQTGDGLGMTAIDSSFFYVCTGAYDGTSNIWVKIALTTTGSWP